MSAATVVALATKSSTCDIPIRNGAPAVDYHVHVGDELTVDQAISIAKQRGVKFGLLHHAGVKGRGYQVTDDDELTAWVRSLEGKPVFVGIEAEGTDWASAFSKDALGTLDYVQADALGLPDTSGVAMPIWKPDFRVDDAQDFMDRYVDYHVRRIEGEPLDIFVMATFMPDALRADADRLWTGKRMDAIIGAAVKHRVALEIDSRFKIPRYPFLERAKAAGAKFAFGSNYETPDGPGDIGYCVEAYTRLGLTLDQFFCPRAKSASR